MKHFLPVLLFAFCPALSCFAQEEDAPEKRPPYVIIQTGIGLQWFGDPYKLSTFSIERPVEQYWHLGLQGSYYFKRNPDYYYSNEFLSGFEIGGFAKYFLHGRLSGRKSGLYFGPEFRFGVRRFQYSNINVFPPPPIPEYIPYNENTTKLMMRWGVQWQFGHASLEIAAPFGIEIYKPNEASYNNSRESQFVLLPTMQLGFAF